MTLKYSPVERRMMKLLSDQEEHSVQELHKCLNDDMGLLKNVYVHIAALRRKLEGINCYIVTRRDTKSKISYYRYVVAASKTKSVKG